MGKKQKSKKVKELVDNIEPATGQLKSEEKIQENEAVVKRSSVKLIKNEEQLAQGTSKVRLPPEDEQRKSLPARDSTIKSSSRGSENFKESSKLGLVDESKKKLVTSSSKVAFKNEAIREGFQSKEVLNIPEEEIIEKTEKVEIKEKKEKKDKKQRKGKKKVLGQEDRTESKDGLEPVEHKKPKKKGGKTQKVTLEKIPSELKPPSTTKLSATKVISKTERDSKTDVAMSKSQIQSDRELTSFGLILKGESSTLKPKSSRKLKKRSSRKLKSSRILDVGESFDTDEFSYSTASSEEVVVKDKKDKRRDTKKDKKSKKKGQKEKSELTLEEPEKDHVKEQSVVLMEEIQRMKAASMQRATTGAGAEIPEPQVAEEEVEKKHKKVPKKKVSKKEKVRLTAELAEKLRIEAEQEAAMLAELERIRLEKEKKEAIEKEKRETAEQQIREEQLEKSVGFIRHVTSIFMDRLKDEREKSEWQLYVDCRRLPNPSLCVQMNTYLHLWEKNLDDTTMEKAAKKTEDVQQLLGELEDLIDNSYEEDETKMEIWKWVRQLFREHQRDSLDVATYRLLRCVEKNMNRIDIPTADFNYKDDFINLSIWLRVQLPIPLPNPRRPPKPRVDVSFTGIGMQVVLPITIDWENMALRGMYLKYDHWSDTCQTYYMPQTPPHYQLDLQTSTKTEWRTRQKYKYDHRDKKHQSSIPPPEPVVEAVISDHTTIKTEEIKIETVVEEPEDFASDEEIPTVPYKKLEPTSSEFAIASEDRIYMETRTTLMIKVPENILNLRKYTILGGVYYINLLYQPPEPQDFVTMDMTITSLYLPKQLEHVPFSVIYKPPVPAEPSVRRLPEEMEEDMKKQEEEMEKLMMVTLTWPQHVMFLELPLVCQWDESKKHWSKENIHDLKHNEEKCILTFRTGLFGIFGLAAVRYANLPYQAWEIRPEADESVTLNITAAILILEFNIKNGLICISQLQNSPNNALQDMVGTYFKLYKLKRIMKQAGVDIFPEYDAFCYISGSCEKQWPMEKHLYNNMARLSNTFNFAWSRWNVAAGRRTIVLQMREYFPSKPKQKNHSMLLVTPLKSMYIDCTEVSQVFSDQGIENQKFSADLFNLMKATSGIAVRKKVQGFSKEDVYAVAELLIAVRILSFS